ncbi:hypothetical protein [Streptomyces apricus]|uniref:hypothetical protein n=1 Tax=Streptomyces apricus TaxID=1828112 RepID=UPI001F2E522E|nr:hypothetical protein [Streptomyces apricus]
MTATPGVTSGRRGVAVVGAALADCGRLDDVTPYALHAQAARRALADSGLDRSVIDGVASAGLGTLAPAEVAEYLGLRPTWVDSTSVGGSTWEVMAAHAADAIAAGHADVVLLVYGPTARADVRAGRRTGNLSFGAGGPLQFEVPYGHSLIAKYAMAARRHMHEYGTTVEQLATVAVRARDAAALNPEAMFREPVTVDDVLAGPMIADPFTKLQCCLRSDGGAAVLLAAEPYVRDCRAAPVWVLGTGEHVSHTTMSEWRRCCWRRSRTYGTAGRLPSGCSAPVSTSRTRRCPSGTSPPSSTSKRARSSRALHSTTSVIIRGPSSRSTTAATYGVRVPKGGRSLRWTTDQV